MTDQQKKVLFWIGSVFGAVLIVYLLVIINQQLNTATTTNTVTFSGMGKVTAKPNVAVTDFAIVTIGTTSKDAQDKNAAKSKAVEDFLAKQGIDEKYIKTSGYNIYPNYSYPRPISQPCSSGELCPEYYDSNPKISGYTVNLNYTVKIRDFDKVSAIVDGLVKAGVNQVNNLAFQIEDPESLKADARTKAIADAKTKASELKSQIGVNLGKIVNFQEDIPGYPGPIMYAKGMAEGGGGGGGGPSLPTGENEVIVTVSITYQIK